MFIFSNNLALSFFICTWLGFDIELIYEGVSSTISSILDVLWLKSSILVCLSDWSRFNANFLSGSYSLLFVIFWTDVLLAKSLTLPL